jgi:AraC-like DNA-binding protein
MEAATMQRTAPTFLDVLPDDSDLIDLVFEGANPNPARLDCPARDAIEQLAFRSLSIEHAGYRHLAQCSPCYRQFRTMRTRASDSPNQRRRGRFEP